MREWWRKWVRSVGRTLNTVLTIALAVILLHDLNLAVVEIPELFSGGAELWTLAYQLSLALVASYVFFFVNVHIPWVRDRDNLNQFLREKNGRIVSNAKLMIGYLQTASDYGHENDYPSLPALRAMCAKIPPRSQAPLYFSDAGRNAHWLEYLNHDRRDTEQTIESIYKNIRFLDSEYLRLLLQIEGCEHFSAFRQVGTAFETAPLQNTDLTAWAPALHDYFTKVRCLEDYADRNSML